MSRSCSELLTDHFERPRHVGQFDIGAADVGTGTAGRRETGGVLRVQLRIDADDLVAAACFKAYGPPALIAAGSWLTESIVGGSLARAGAIVHTDIAAALNLPSARLYCAMLAEDAVRAAIQDFKDKQEVYA